MSTNILDAFSTQLADLAASAAAAVVQVHGARRPASGVVYGNDTVITTARAIGREDGLRVRLPEGQTLDADLAGWDPATGIAVLRTRGTLALQAPAKTDDEPRVGHFVLALARSWSNSVTASPGTVAVVGGPLRTGRRRQIARVIRITASVHEGFAGGGVFDTKGRLTGIATATSIRGFGVVIPAAIAWAAAEQVVTSGTPRRGFVGVAVQSVTLTAAQRSADREAGLLVVSVTPASPAESAGLMVGDVLLDFDGHTLAHSDDLLDLLTDRTVGQTVTVRTLRGAAVHEMPLTVASRE